MPNLNDVEKVGCTHEKQLVVFIKQKWYTCLLNENLEETETTNVCLSLSEFVVNSTGVGTFRTLKGKIEKELDAAVVSNVKLKQANGRYKRMLGGYKNKNGFWIVRNNCGQEMIVYPTKRCNKIVAVKNSRDIMEIDLSVSPSEIRCLVNQFMWSKCKKIVNNLREKKNNVNNYMNVTLQTIETNNKGKKKKCWL